MNKPHLSSVPGTVANILAMVLLVVGPLALPVYGAEQTPSVSLGGVLRFPVGVDGSVIPDEPINLQEDVIYDPSPYPLDCIAQPPSTPTTPPVLTPPLPETKILWNIDDHLDEEGRLRVRAKAHDCLNRAKVTVERHNDFIMAGHDGDGVVTAQVSATVHIKGFILLMGPGEAAVNSWLNVIDVTDGAPEEGSIVASELIYEKNVQTSLIPDLGLEVGFPSGVGASISFAGEGTKVRLDRSFDVGFVVLLQRGHRYRLELTLTGLARRGILPGVSWVGFWAREIQPPDLLEPESWKAALQRIAALVDGTIDQKVAQNCVLGGLLGDTNVSFAGELAARGNGILESLKGKLNSLDQISFSTTNLRSQPGGILPDGTIGNILDSCGLPEVITGRLFVDWIDGQLDRAAAEFLQGAGAEMYNLQVTVAGGVSDDIESHLTECSRQVELFLPAEFGGRLEEVFSVVERRINQVAEAGLNTRTAGKKLDKAQADFSEGKYRKSYDHLCNAYKVLGRK